MHAMHLMSESGG